VGFFEWLGKQKGRRNPVGEFARNALRDASFPREVESLDALLVYVRGTKASAQTVAVARTAYRDYERSVRPAPRP
jgi:uncharacterized protein YozE (UPF0346 family)